MTPPEPGDVITVDNSIQGTTQRMLVTRVASTGVAGAYWIEGLIDPEDDQ